MEANKELNEIILICGVFALFMFWVGIVVGSNEMYPQCEDITFYEPSYREGFNDGIEFVDCYIKQTPQDRRVDFASNCSEPVYLNQT